jgi:hypothetical protein
MNFIRVLQKNNVFWLILVISVCFSLGCTQIKERVMQHNIHHIKIAYLPKGINPNMAINECNDIFQYQPVLKDTLLTNIEFLNSFTTLINRLNEADEHIDYDFRIFCLIFFKDKNTPHKLCLGEGYLTVYNDVLMEDSKELFELLNETLYAQ